MGSWNGTKLGLKVNPKDEKLAAQFLHCIGVDTDDDIIEEIEALSDSFAPAIEGKVKGKLLGIMPLLKAHFSDYLDQFFGGYEEEYEDEEYDEEEYEEDDEGEDSDDDQPDFDLILDDLFGLVNTLFPPAHLYLAHEEGNNTSDDYYRYEVIYSPKTNYYTEKDCFYSYSEGINVDTDNPEEEGTETRTAEIVKNELKGEVIDWLTQKAKACGYNELAQRLTTCK